MWCFLQHVKRGYLDWQGVDLWFPRQLKHQFSLFIMAYLSCQLVVTLHYCFLNVGPYNRYISYLLWVAWNGVHWVVSLELFFHNKNLIIIIIITFIRCAMWLINLLMMLWEASNLPSESELFFSCIAIQGSKWRKFGCHTSATKVKILVTKPTRLIAFVTALLLYYHMCWKNVICKRCLFVSCEEFCKINHFKCNLIE